jgi:hypothetical protein
MASFAPSPYVCVRTPADIARVRELVRSVQSASARIDNRKVEHSLAYWLASGCLPGDQGWVAPATPLLYVDSLEPAHWSAAVLLYGDGCMEECVQELRKKQAEEAAKAADASGSATTPAATGAAESDEDDHSWMNAPVSFFVSFATNGSGAAADARVLEMLRALVPLRASTFFSCIPARFETHLQSLSKETFSPAKLNFNHSRLWDCKPGKLVPVDTDSAASGDAAHASSDGSVASAPSPSAGTAASAATSSSSPSPSPRPLAAGFTIAPLREEHVDLVVSNWPWRSPSAGPLIRALIQRMVTCCLYDADGVPQAWCLEQTYSCIGMLHTQPEVRGRGYAPRVVHAFVGAMNEAIKQRQQQQRSESATDDASAPLDPWAVITTGNVASEKMFAKRGFVPTADMLWVRWDPLPLSSLA